MSETTETVETDRGGTGVAVPRALARSPRPGVPSIVPQSKRRGIGLRLSIARALDERRLFVLLPFAMIAGLVVSVIVPSAPEPLALAGVGVTIAVGVPLAWRSHVAIRLLSLFAAFWLGFALLAIHGTLFGTEMLRRSAYGPYEVRVDEIVAESETGKRVLVSGITPQDDARPVPIRRARIIIDDTLDLAPGDVIRAPIRFYPVPGPVIPNGFDTQFHAYFDGIGAYGNTTGAVTVVRHGESSTPEHVIDAIRRGIGARIDGSLPQPSAGIAKALITGDQTEVTDEAREVMSVAGLAHVLSVSGLHLTIVAGGVFVALRMGLSLIDGIGRRVSVKRLAASGGIISALLYFAISGGNVAALRSTIMIVLVLGAVLFGRRALTMRNVAIAALLVIVSDPASIFRPSFQLSFAAVVALIGAWELVKRNEGKDRSLVAQLAGYFGGAAVTSLVAGLATLLFSVYHFQQTSPLGLVGNLVSLPLVSFVMMPAAVFATLMMPFGFEGPFLAAMGWSIDRMIDLATIVAAWSGGLDASPLLAPLALALGFLAFAWFAFFGTWHRLIAPVLLLPAVLLFALDKPPDVLIADTTQALAVRGANGLGLVIGKPDSFAVEVWRETYGEPFEKDEAMLACDGIGCFGRSPAGFVLAVIKDPAGFYEDCGLADVVVTRRNAPKSCMAGVVIDADDLVRGGVHWLRWNVASGSFEVRTAISQLKRPWRAEQP